MNITIIGTGYVGLVTGACLGNHVFCLDVDQTKIDLLNSGGVPIYEPGLKEVIERNVEAGRLPVIPAKAGIQGPWKSWIPGTSPRMTSMSAVIPAFPVIPAPSVIPAKAGIQSPSQSPIPTFSVVSNPEFLKEGAAVEDFTRPDRIVLGVADDAASHPHQLHERAGQPSRTGWGRHRTGAPRHRLRPPHWLQLSVCRDVSGSRLHPSP